MEEEENSNINHDNGEDEAIMHSESERIDNEGEDSNSNGNSNDNNGFVNKGNQYKVSIGWDIGDSCNNLHSAFSEAKRCLFDFITLPLVHPRQIRNENERDKPLTRSDTLLSAHQWSSIVVGKTSKWISLTNNDCFKSISDGGDNDLNYSQQFIDNENAFREEISWAVHLSLPAVVIPLPSKENIFLYAQIVNQLLLQSYRLQLWVDCPIIDSDGNINNLFKIIQDQKLSASNATVSNNLDDDNPWKRWNLLRTLCGNHPYLHVAIRFTNIIPEKSILERWLGEPVKACWLPCSIFKENKNGFPSLNTQFQELVSMVIKRNVQIVVSGAPKIKGDIGLYTAYLFNLTSKIPGMSDEEAFEYTYHDYLQSPLQPLMDNLESQTYETFEKDPVKYQQYEEAIFQALKARNKSAVIMVVGAGRGPLIRSALKASKRADIPITVFGIEKNPNAIITLRNLKHNLQWNNVTIVHQDMRSWNAPMLADILVSELLGSFGDNELSPECLDGAQRFLNPETGISIPCSYTSFVAPMTSHKLWNLARALDQGAGGASTGGALGGGLASSERTTKNFETPYVVKMHNFYHISSPQECFTFTHPNWNRSITNRRVKHFSFVAEENALIHGFAGYFETVLYENVKLSINPSTYSTGMFSWFPIFFPVSTPVHVKKGETITAAFWRQANTSKVWYEWTVLSPTPTMIHNPNGRSYVVQLL